ncbi:hypothetical protein DPMN_035822 [Dreissena polymorpha]|uniref:Uncharacterized protein n=1 Tax=Dreissena polymorpha TaxID=45954 RepID=A0A9D4M9J4_DREPO|nr:hypothetical protein DPMN_035822 [Dreissena polymorpha]
MASKKVIVSTASSSVLSNTNIQMAECDLEEADTRLVLHLKDAIERGAKYVKSEHSIVMWSSF